MITSIIQNNTVRFNNNNIKLSGNADFESVLTIMQAWYKYQHFNYRKV